MFVSDNKISKNMNLISKSLACIDLIIKVYNYDINNINAVRIE